MGHRKRVDLLDLEGERWMRVHMAFKGAILDSLARWRRASLTSLVYEPVAGVESEVRRAHSPRSKSCRLIASAYEVKAEAARMG